MKKLLTSLLLVFTSAAYAADIKISQLPLGTAATTGTNDSFPYVAASTNITKRLTIWDLVNIPTVVATYAPKANPTFTGVVTAPSFVGALTGNASTATALAANPTDCSSNQYANAIAANGNLTCSAVTTSQLSGTVGVAQGGTGITSGSGGGVLAFTASGVIASSLGGSSGQILRSAGAAAVPTWSTATYPNTTTANRILYSSATNTISEITSAATGALVTNSSSVPSFASGTTANRVLRTDGTSVTFSQVAAAADVSGQLPLANGGTGQATKAAAYDALSPLTTLGDIVYGGASGTGTRLAGNTTATPYFLTQTGNGSVSATPVWRQFIPPTIQRFTSGTAQTYTTPAGVLYLIVTVSGGGGGGSGSGTVSPGNGGAGNTSTFGTSLLTATGGGAGVSASSGSGGGSATVNSPALTIIAVTGGGGDGSSSSIGAHGGSNPLGGGAPATFGTNVGVAGAANSGAGGSGGGVGGGATGVSGGGAAGGFLKAVIPNPSASYTYTVGGTASGGSAGTGGQVGGGGAAGIIIVEEYYQ